MFFRHVGLEDHPAEQTERQSGNQDIEIGLVDGFSCIQPFHTKLEYSDKGTGQGDRKEALHHDKTS